MTDAPVTVVAGSGPSLAAIDPGRVLASDRIIRVNNFFFEDRFHLGRRVDLAYVSGDPRVVPFMCATLKKARAQYDLREWSAPGGRVARIAGRHLGRLPYRPVPPPDAETAAEIARLTDRYGVKPSSGVQALLLAQAMGARRIILAGIDLYSAENRYVYTPGRHQRDLLGDDLGNRAWDLRLHHPDFDRALIGWLANRPGLTLWRAADVPALNGLLDLAPERDGPRIVVEPKERIEDWAGWAGLYPIRLLKILRRLRRWQRTLTGDLPR